MGVTVNGVTQRVPLTTTPDFTITPYQASEESPGGKHNTLAILRFSENGPAIQNPVVSLATAQAAHGGGEGADDARLLGRDDALYSSGSNAPINDKEKPVEARSAATAAPARSPWRRPSPSSRCSKGGKAGVSRSPPRAAPR
ncbi:MAG: hypothetical protein R2708_17435 [Vicinamibacterales bacterium]